MPDWQSPEEVQRDAAVFMKFMHALLGLYIYEYVLSFDFEWDFITGKKKFRWPMFFYFANRYMLLASLTGITIALDSTMELNCQVLYGFNQISGQAAIGLSSINLSIRTIAVWSQNRYIIALLVLLIVGHWSLIFQGVQLTSVWVPESGCVITKTNTKIFIAMLIYSMCFDLTVLCLNAYKLLEINGKGEGNVSSRSRIGQMIFKDGLSFFIVAFLCNVIATVVMLLNLNSIMNVIFDVPAGVFSTIVATRAVRRLTNFANRDFFPHSMSSSAPFRIAPIATAGISSRESPAVQSFKHMSNTGVHIKMDTFTHVDDSQDTMYETGKANRDLEADLEAKGNAI